MTLEQKNHHSRVDKIEIDYLGIAQNKLIKKIVQEGLRPSASLIGDNESCFRSSDRFPGKLVSGANFYLISHSQKENLTHISKKLYGTAMGVLPVVAERQGEGLRSIFDLIAINKQETEEKLACSMLVVYFGLRSKYYVLKEEELLTPEEMQFILLPKKMAENFQPGELSRLNKKFRIVKKEKEVTYYNRKKIMIPNYEDAILELLDKKRCPFWIHGVRLPTQNDIDTGRFRMV
ncbi:hypothetical protein ACFL1Q_02980 [Patescibacteria group bacterium]